MADQRVYLRFVVLNLDEDRSGERRTVSSCVQPPCMEEAENRVYQG